MATRAPRASTPAKPAGALAGARRAAGAVLPEPGTGNGPEDLAPSRPERGPASVPGWVPLATTVMCVLALADSAYLMYTHFAGAKLAFCTYHGLVNCSLVTNSSYSHPFGIPIVIPGVIWSAAMLALCSPWAWRAASPWVARLRLAGSAAGVAMVLWLVYVEAVKLHHICEYCTGVHILTVALFVVIIFATALAEPAGSDLDYEA